MGSLRDIRREAHYAPVSEYVPPQEENQSGGWRGYVGPTGPMNTYTGPVGPVNTVGYQGVAGSVGVVGGPQTPKNKPAPWQCVPGTGTCGPQCPQNHNGCEPNWNHWNKPQKKPDSLFKTAYGYLKEAFKLGRVATPWR